MKRVLALILFLAASPLGAATLFLSGFESGDSEENDSNAGTFSIVTSPVRTGTYAFRANPTTTAVGNLIVAGVAAAGGATAYGAATVYHRFYFRYATKPTTGDEEIFRARAGASIKFQLRINSAGNLVAYQQDLVSLSTGTTVLNANTWYRIEARVGTAVAGSGVWEVKINGTSEISGSTADLLNSNNTRSNYGKSTNYNGNTVDFFYDDILLSNSAFPGEGQVTILYPVVNGSSNTWTIGAGAGSNYENVDEIPSDAVTTYLLSTLIAEQQELMGMRDTGVAGITGTVSSVRSEIRIKRNGAANGSVQHRVLSGATASNNSNFGTTSAYTSNHRILDTDPDTSVAWTLSGIDGAEVGALEKSTTNASQMSTVYLHVDYTPATAKPRRTLLGVGL